MNIRNVVFVLATLAPIAVFASSSNSYDDHRLYCIHLGIVFQQAALVRSTYGWSPQSTYKYLIKARSSPPTKTFPAGTFDFPNRIFKGVVNLVYFNPGFIQLAAEGELYDAVINECLNPPPQWHPVR